MIKIFDCHCDTVTSAMSSGQKLYSNNLHIDFERLLKFDCACQFFGIWLDDEQRENAFENTNKAIDFLYEQIAENTSCAHIAVCADDIKDKFVNAFLSIEGGEAIEGSFDKLRHFYDRGVRIMTLTWNYINDIGSGAITGSTDGLTAFGKTVVKKMNEMGMLVDVSHLNEAGFYDVCRAADAPFLATHSNAYALCAHPRNLKDDQIKQIVSFGGVIGLNLYPPFVCFGGRCRTDDIVRHADYILNKAGEDRVVLGCDFDGIGILPDDIKEISGIEMLYDKFVKNFGKNTAEKIFYENMRSFIEKNL